MGEFLQIKSKFEFLVKEFNFQIIGEKTTEISAYDFQCDIVKYINN